MGFVSFTWNGSARAKGLQAGHVVRPMTIEPERRNRALDLAGRLKVLRKDRGLTLDQLARQSGISKSMLSQIERGEANPTLATVWSLATALKLEISELIGSKEQHARVELTPATFIPEIRTEDGLCVLRILSPAACVGVLEWYELLFAPGGALRSSAHAHGMKEHLTVLTGSLEVELPDHTVTVRRGDTARYPVDVVHNIVNNGRGEASALLIMIA